MYSHRRRSSTTSVTVILACVAAMAFVPMLMSYYKDTPVTIVVKDKESISKGGGHEYRIYTDREVYAMKDSIVKGRFRTANDYAALDSGKTYRCQSFGWRVPVFSTFENLHSCKRA